MKRKRKKALESPANPVGRPTKYTSELGENICALMAQGYVLTQIEEIKDMPRRVTIVDWAVRNEEFSAMYARARELMYDWHADNLFRADKDPAVYALKDDFGKTDRVPLDAKRLYCDNVKWALARILPKKYGDKQQHEHSGPDQKPIQFLVSSEPLTEEEWAKRYGATDSVGSPAGPAEESRRLSNPDNPMGRGKGRGKD